MNMTNVITELKRTEELTLDEEAAVQQVFPKLRALHDNEKIFRAVLEETHPDLAGQEVEVSPYYMNSYDPPELGVWKVAADGFKCRVQTAPISDDSGATKLHVKFLVAAAEDKYIAADEESIRKAVAILKVFDETVSLEDLQREKPKRRGLVSLILARSNKKA